MSALVIGHNLIRFHLPCFQCHAVGIILGEEVFNTKRISQEDFRTGVHHLVHVNGTRHHAFLFLIVILVIEIEFRTVTIPQCIRHIRKLGIELGYKFILEGNLTINDAIPPQFDTGLVQVIDNRLGRCNQLQLIFFTDGTCVPLFYNTVELFEYLLVGIYWEFASLQLQQ